MAFSTCEGSLKMGPICGVYFKLKGATKRVCVRQAVEEMFTSNIQKLAASELLWAMSARVTEKQCLHVISQSQQLMQPGISGNTLLYNKTLFWWNLNCADTVQAGSDGSVRAVCTLYGTIQSSKICRQHQITKRECWQCAGTICYHCVLPEHVIYQWGSSRWTEAVKSSFIENNLFCPEAMSVLKIRLNSMMEFIHSVNGIQRVRVK